jgi:hypothetical protein
MRHPHRDFGRRRLMVGEMAALLQIIKALPITSYCRCRVRGSGVVVSIVCMKASGFNTEPHKATTSPKRLLITKGLREKDHLLPKQILAFA